MALFDTGVLNVWISSIFVIAALGVVLSVTALVRFSGASGHTPSPRPVRVPEPTRELVGAAR